MATINVTQADVASAAAFIESYISDKYPTIDVTPGSMFRDVLVDGMASLVAYLRAEVSRIKSLQSLSSIATLPDDQDRDDAIDALLSNFFLSRKIGRLSRGLATLHLSSPVDVIIPTTAVFSRGGLNFVPDYTTDQVIPASTLVAVVNATGVVSDYTATISLLAAAQGVEYDIPVGRFDSYTQASPELTSVTADNSFSGGSSIETTDELLSRASTAVTLRGMITSKSVRTTLLDEYTSLIDAVVIGMGDPEMHRDSLPLSEFHSGLHRGGFTDIYIDTGVKESVVVEGVIGDSGVLVTQLPILLADSSVPDPVAAGVTNGQFMKIYNPTSGDPDLFAVTGTASNAVVVDSRLPFPGVRTSVDYSIGTVAPNYDDVISRRASGEFTTSFQVDDGIILGPTPILRVTDVSLYDPTGATDTGFAVYRGLDDRIHFSHVPNTNSAPAPYGDPLYYPAYTMEYFNPQEARSNKQGLVIHTDVGFSGYTLRVTYDTILDYDVIEARVNGADSRLLTANTLVKAFNPVYLSFFVKYTLKPTADSATIDEEAIKSALAVYLNSISLSDTLNVSDIVSFVMAQDSNIGSVIPAALADPASVYAIYYTLHAPNGNETTYITTDEVVVEASKWSSGASLTDAEAAVLGISTRTIRYIASTSDITFLKI